MKILIIGGNGMLGHKIFQTLCKNHEVWVTLRGNFSNYKKFNLYSKKRIIQSIDVEGNSIFKVLERLKPEVIFNAVGVIKQLPTSKNVVKTLQINSIFPHLLNEFILRINARLINISTDCVFDGKEGNYREEDESNANDIYGKSKYLGEVVGANCLTIRTSIIGRELETSHSLVEWFLSNRGGNVKGFVNAIYSGFPTIILSEIIADLIENHRKLNGLYHISSDPINKYDLLQLINEAYKAKIEVEPFEDFRIDRSLDSSKFRDAVNFQPQSWDEMIRRMANDPTPYDDWRK